MFDTILSYLLGYGLFYLCLVLILVAFCVFNSVCDYFLKGCSRSLLAHMRNSLPTPSKMWSASVGLLVISLLALELTELITNLIYPGL